MLKYAGNILASNELVGLKLDNTSGEAVLGLYHFHPEEARRDIIILAMLTIAYRLIAGTLLDALKTRHM